MRERDPATQELEPEALAMAADIRRRAGRDLFEGFEDLEGWAAVSTGPVAVWSKRGEQAPVIRVQAEIDARPLVVAALVKEADLGPAAADLVQWRVGRITPFLEVVHYVNRLPPPLTARDFCVTERYGVDADGSVLALGEDFDSAALAPVKPSVKAVVEWTERGCVRASLRRSAYHIEPLWRPDGTLATRLRRVLELDLRLWWPAPVAARMLARTAARDVHRVRQMAPGFAGSPLERRTEIDWFYKVVNRHEPVDAQPDTSTWEE